MLQKQQDQLIFEQSYGSCYLWYLRNLNQNFAGLHWPSSFTDIEGYADGVYSLFISLVSAEHNCHLHYFWCTSLLLHLLAICIHYTEPLSTHESLRQFRVLTKLINRICHRSFIALKQSSLKHYRFWMGWANDSLMFIYLLIQFNLFWSIVDIITRSKCVLQNRWVERQSN